MVVRVPELLTVPEVAEILRVCVRTVWRLINEQELECRRIRRRVFVTREALDSYLRRPGR